MTENDDGGGGGGGVVMTMMICSFSRDWEVGRRRKKVVFLIFLLRLPSRIFPLFCILYPASKQTRILERRKEEGKGSEKIEKEGEAQQPQVDNHSWRISYRVEENLKIKFS